MKEVGFKKQKLMKKTFIAISALALIVSCAKEISPVQSGSTDGIDVRELSATIVDNETKAALNGKSVAWEQGDKLLIFNDKGNNNNVSGKDHAAFIYSIKNESIENNGRSASFVAEEPVNSNEYILALYPYIEKPLYVNGHNNGSSTDANGRGFRQYIPTEQHYVKDGVASGIIPMMAYAQISTEKKPELKFNYGAGIVQLNLTSSKNQKVKKIRLNTTYSGVENVENKDVVGSFCTGSFYFYEKSVIKDWDAYYGKNSNSNRFAYADIVCDTPVELNDKPTAFNFVVSGQKYTSFAFVIEFEDGSSYTLAKGSTTEIKKGHIYRLPSVNTSDFDKTTTVIIDDVTEISIEGLTSTEVNSSIKVSSSAENKIIPATTLALIANKVKQCASPVSVDFSNVNLADDGKGNVIMPTVFAENSKLGAIILPANTTTLPTGCFKDCVNLKSATLNEGLLTTQGTIFWNDNENVGTLNLPKSFAKYGSCGLAWCEAFTVTEGNVNGFYAKDGVLFKKTTLAQYPKFKSGTSYTIPDGITEINQHAFYANKDLTEIIFPASVTTVLPQAFHGSRNLNVIDLSAIGAGNAAPVAFKYNETTISDAGANVGADAKDKKIILPNHDATNSAESIIAKYIAAGWSVLINGKDEYGTSYGWHLYIDGEEVTDSQISSAISSLSGKKVDWNL